nr:MAG TPA: FlaG protein [Caudoviricetes sp.]
MVLEIEKRLEEFSLISGETISIRHPEKDIIKVTDTKHNKVVGTFTREEFTTLMLRAIEMKDFILLNNDIIEPIIGRSL